MNKKITGDKKAKIFIGTSGWHYKHWKGTYYPSNIKAKEQFSYYAGIFETVEINNSFYRLPTEETFKSWYSASPENFVFAVKASRFITHMKKLNIDRQNLWEILDRAALLKEKLGPVLFQLPPGWKLNIERLEYFLSILPTEYRYTIEFRNDSWYTGEVYALLKKYHVAFCIYHLAGHLSPIEITADFIYIRLHGPGGKYQGNYTDGELKKWSNRMKKWQKEGKDVYLYFDNDDSGYAGFNAEKVLRMIK